MRRLTRLSAATLSILVSAVNFSCSFDTSGIPPDPTPQVPQLEGCFQSSGVIVRTLELNNPSHSLLNGHWCQVKQVGTGSEAIIMSVEGSATKTGNDVVADLSATVLPGSVSEIGEQFELTVLAPLPADTVTVEGFLPLSRIHPPLVGGCPCPPRPPLEIAQ